MMPYVMIVAGSLILVAALLVHICADNRSSAREIVFIIAVVYGIVSVLAWVLR